MIAVYSGLDHKSPPPNMASRNKESLFNCRNVSVAAILIIFLFWYYPHLGYDARSVMGMFTMFPREWIRIEDAIPVEAQETKFTLVTYNLLNSQFMRPGTYNYVPKDMLHLKDRHPRIMVEIQAMHPDIIGMEEVDVNYFHKTLNPSMIALGYVGGIAVDMDGTKVGQTLFWKADKFKMLSREHHLLHDLASPHIKEALEAGTLKAGEEKIFRDWLKRRTVVLMAHLQHVPSRARVIVAAIHVTWDVLQLPALQTLQIALAVQAMTAMSEKTGTQAMIIAGDFNTPPDFPAYSFLKQGSLGPEQKNQIKEITDKAGILTQDYRRFGISVLDILPKVFKHNLQLASAYYTVLGEEPEITNADDFDTRVGLPGVHTYCLDYIWFTNKALGVSAVLKTPTKEEILKHIALPSERFPSDHLPLKAEFYLKHTTS